MKNYFVLKSTTLLSLMILMLSSCTEPTTIGSELQDSIDAFYTDTLSLRMTTVREDSIKTFDPNPDLAFSSYFCGNYKDDIIGTTRSSVFTQLGVSSSPDSTFYAINGSVLDSVILHLPYNINTTYGNSNSTYAFEVYRMTEAMDQGDTYYTSNTFGYDPSPIGGLTFTPGLLTDTTTVEYIFPREGSTNDTFNVVNHLRIPLDLSFGEEFINLSPDAETMEETTELLNFINGLHIKSVNPEDEGMIGLRLNQLASANSFGAGITFFYHYMDDGIKKFRRHNLLVASSTSQLLVKTTSASIELSNEVETALEVPVEGNDVAYIQGLIGPNIQFEIPYLEDFKNTIINKAELILTVASDEDEDRTAPLQIIVATRAADGTYEATDDVLFAINRGTFSIFGGQEEEVGDLRQYRFNLSAVFQQLVDVNNEPLYLSIFPKAEYVSRMTVFGPEHNQYPAKLDLFYTKLPE